MRRAFALALVLGAAGCAPVDIVVADLGPLADGGRPQGGGPCADNGDCPPDAFCEKPDCAALVGRCEHRPVFCGDAPQPVCGCNGVNYWNGCWRRLSGIASQTEGECTSASVCGGPTAQVCPDADAVCARLVPQAAACTVNPTGTCWVLPVSCVAGTGGAWSPCAGGACVDTCSAIRSQAPHSRLTNCP